ncbi:hypothetical protein ACH5RR_037157 [Cinchona calisaya]|uniref:RNase H type-1 domain-containing protein n=1 Tax=Cinchona calisaya TaxID=153742 RepID=A0ABD2Y5D7_9GENT
MQKELGYRMFREFGNTNCWLPKDVKEVCKIFEHSSSERMKNLMHDVHTGIHKGMICKDDQGKLRRVWAFSQDRSLSNNAMEAETIRSAMIKARDAAWDNVQILSSNKAVMDKLA